MRPSLDPRLVSQLSSSFVSLYGPLNPFFRLGKATSWWFCSVSKEALLRNTHSRSVGSVCERLRGREWGGGFSVPGSSVVSVRGSRDGKTVGWSAWDLCCQNKIKDLGAHHLYHHFSSRQKAHEAVFRSWWYDNKITWVLRNWSSKIERDRKEKFKYNWKYKWPYLVKRFAAWKIKGDDLDRQKINISPLSTTYVSWLTLEQNQSCKKDNVEAPRLQGCPKAVASLASDRNPGLCLDSRNLFNAVTSHSTLDMTKGPPQCIVHGRKADGVQNRREWTKMVLFLHQCLSESRLGFLFV